MVEATVAIVCHPAFGIGAFALVAFSGLGWLIYRDRKIEEKRQQEWLQEHTKRTIERIEAIDKALEQWLVGLELPQLADQKRREEAARQLGTVLTEKVMRLPSYLRNPTAHQQTK